MAKQITIPSQQYTPTGGPQGDGRYTATLDAFPANVDRIRVSLSRESWPVGTVARLYVKWDDGSGVDGAELPGGVILRRDGTPATHSVIVIDVPQIPDGQGGLRKKNVVGGIAMMEVLQTLTTEISAEAI